MVFRATNPCGNVNHTRRDAPVRHCPECGVVVNARVSKGVCAEPKHGAARRRQTRYCSDCGAQLMV